MAAAGQTLCCRTEAEWSKALEQLVEDEPARRDAGQGGRAFVEREYADERLLSAWDAVLASV
jgi:hypothetical protein